MGNPSNKIVFQIMYPIYSWQNKTTEVEYGLMKALGILLKK